MINKFLLFTKISLELDFRTLYFTPKSLNWRVEFIIKKYAIIIKHVFKRFELGDSVKLSGKEIFYDSKLGFAGYQSMITRHYKLIQCVDELNPKIIFDCGANVGFYSLFANDLFPSAKIISFEPIPHVYKLLEKNTSDRKNINTVNAGLSDAKQTVQMRFDKNNSVISKITESGNLTINTDTIDNYCNKNHIDRIDVLKIDTEGHEVEVLSGAAQTLSKVQYIVLEVNLLEEDYTVSRLMSLLFGDGYDFQLIGYRNYSGKSEGKITLMDIILENKCLVEV